MINEKIMQWEEWLKSSNKDVDRRDVIEMFYEMKNEIERLKEENRHLLEEIRRINEVIN